MTEPKFHYRKFVVLWHFVGWSAFSLGFHVDFACPNIEIHLPFGFIKFGWEKYFRQTPTFMESFVEDLDKRLRGIEKYIAHERINKELSR